MRQEDCFYLGKITSKFSFKGEVLAKLDADRPEAYEGIDAVFVAQGGHLIPFHINHCRLHKSSLLRIAFEDVKDEADAEKLIGLELYLPLTLLPPLAGNQFYFHEIIGFTVIDETLGNIGLVTAVNDNTPQALIEVEKEGKPLLIPIHDEIILKVDRENQLIHVKTPEGLVEIYLGK